jgi:hypothetical protein
MAIALNNPYETTPGKGTGSIRGIVGKINWSYYPAADLHGYKVSRDDKGHWSLVGFLGVNNSYNLAQRPLTFRAEHKGGAWEWPIESIEILDNHLVTAELGNLK